MTRAPGKTWTQDEIDLVDQWVRENPHASWRDTVAEVANLLDRTVGSVGRWVAESRSKLRKERKETPQPQPRIQATTVEAQGNELDLVGMVDCLSDSLADTASKLHTMQEQIDRLHQEAQVLDSWIRQTLDLRRRLPRTYIGQDGFIDSMERKY